MTKTPALIKFDNTSIPSNGEAKYLQQCYLYLKYIAMQIIALLVSDARQLIDFNSFSHVPLVSSNV